MAMDYFIATADEVVHPNLFDGPEACGFTTVSSGGIDCFALSALDELVTGTSNRMPELVCEEGEEGPSIYHISPQLQDFLAELLEEDIDQVVDSWSMDTEWEVILPITDSKKFLTSFVHALQKLARKGLKNEKKMFLYISL